MQPAPGDSGQRSPDSLIAIFGTFLKLGLTAFGGPIAHLGYFREAFVVRRKWLSEEHYADLVALCQFLPGPASSQVGFALGVLRGKGVLGGLAAWLGFTLPSAIVLFGFALGAAAFTGPPADGSMHGSMHGLIHGLKLVAVAVVAQAVWGMARSLASDRARAGIALGAVMLLAFLGGPLAQLAAIASGACAGLWLCRGPVPDASGHPAFPVSRRQGGAALVLFAILLLGTPALAALTGSPGVSLFDAFYRAGALVFGGGHVVLPLLQAEMVEPGRVTRESFLAGYGVAQAMPGPLFTFAAYLGAQADAAANPASGAMIALVAVFLPGLLLVYGMLPFQGGLRTRPAAQYAMRGANAAVVGILGAALYDPVWTGAVRDARDVALCLAGFLLLTVWKAAPWIVVAILAAAGALLATVG